ncbi:MAG: hypothetical protein ABIP89_03025 [Polyangiaceae bacterium]
MKHRALLSTCLVATMAFSMPALAQDAIPKVLDVPHKVRSGLVLGFNFGMFGLFGASGYPNRTSQIDQPGYYSSSGTTFGLYGNTFSLHIMGAIADYLNFGIWFGGGAAQNSDWISSSGGAGVRIEAFPFYALNSKVKDIGIIGQFGVGVVTLKARHGNSPGADGAQSFLGTGVFYEFNLGKSLGGHFGWGPSLEYQAITSTSAERHGGVIGARLAFYGGM